MIHVVIGITMMFMIIVVIDSGIKDTYRNCVSVAKELNITDTNTDRLCGKKRT